ncbi:glycosyltransferase [Maribacter sp. ANRC-HE7]|uniref:Glycosyltransferase n=1 Tax=Maribacter aquimaris TaxID=2737171 RepID=A0ABR7V4F4_9FLAO|nr:glycosyltransferase [Maribacter aquimaris]MBD0778834.1 glycosyltransferase [Maribacter aquimaris]
MNRNLPNIAFLLGSTCSHGGIERVTSLLASTFAEKAIAEIHAVAFQPRDREQVYEWSEKVTFFELMKERKSMKSGIFKAVPKLRKYLKNNSIDILIVCGHLCCPLGGFSVLGTNTKMIYWSHSSYYGEVNHFKRINEHIGAICSKVVISLTKADKLNYRKKTLAKKVTQIYNPIDENLFLKSSPYNPNTNKIISVGRLDHPKNFESYLLEVAQMVLSKNPEYTWHIYGKGSLHDLIKENIDKLGLTGKVILEGNVTDLYEQYSKYSLMVMTSSYEGFPMSLLEGMVNKLPLVSFDIQTGPNEIIQNDKSGFLIVPYDRPNMAKKIQELIDCQDLRINFSRASEILINQYKMDTVLKKWTKLLNNLIDN